MKQYQQVYNNMNFKLHYAIRTDQNAQTEDIAIQTKSTVKPLEKSVCKKLPKRPAGFYRKKFKIAALSIFFMLIFPKYTKIVRQLRKKHFTT